MANRFKVAPVEERTFEGIVFASKREMMRYANLRLMERGGAISQLSVQPEFKVEINGLHFCTYTADFKYFDALLDKWVIEEVKSSGTAKDAAYRLRKKAAELFFGIKITVILK
jgi:hypothetical protein